MKLWPDVPNSWEVNVVDLAGDVTHRWFNVPDGVAALIEARRLYDDPTARGSVYVLTPRGSAYRVADNGYTRVGF